MKATTPADIKITDTPKTRRPAKNITILGKRYWVVRVRGDGNYFFRSVSKAVHHNHNNDHMRLQRAACQWVIANEPLVEAYQTVGNV